MILFCGRTRRKSIKLSAFSFLIAVFLWGYPPIISGQEGRPNFSGMWRLNVEKSENPEEVIKKAISESMGERSGKMPGKRGSGGGRGSRGGGNRSGSRAWGRGMGGRGSGRPNATGKQEDLMNELREGMKLLLITHKEPVFDIMDGNEKKQILCTDGRATKQTTARGEIDVKAKWKDSTLEVTSISPGKPTILKKYSLTPDGKQLNVTVQLTVERLDKKVEIRYVYDLIP